LGLIIDQFRGTIRETPVSRPTEVGQVRGELQQYDFLRPVPLDDLTADVARLLRIYSLHVTHPRYFGLFNPGVREAGIVAETLAAAFNPQLAAWSHSPIANEIEEHVLRQFSALLGFPATTAANFTTGGAEANLSAVVVALGHQFPVWSNEGLAALKTKPRIYLSADAHDSLVKAVRVCGLGDSAIRRVPTTPPSFALDSTQLEKLIEDDRRNGWCPFMIVGTAGTTSTGAIDSLELLASIAQKYGAWFHVDAAWGGTAVLSPNLRQEVSGIELADSITWDAHKWLSVPFSAGMFFCRHAASVRSAFSVNASYMPAHSAGTTDPYATTIQWTRRAIGLKVFMCLAELGLDGYRRVIEHQAAMGALLRQRLEEEGFQVVNQTALPLICFTHPAIRENKRNTRDLLEGLYSRGQVWISDVLPSGHTERFLRACITHYETNEGDIDCLLRELANSISDG
jgi:glutamate/tyrosine decarboxylase-like PLP-dependent enzyme